MEHAILATMSLSLRSACAVPLDWAEAGRNDNRALCVDSFADTLAEPRVDMCCCSHKLWDHPASAVDGVPKEARIESRIQEQGDRTNQMRSPIEVMQQDREPPLRISDLHRGHNSIDDDLNSGRIQTEQLEVSRNFELALVEDASERPNLSSMDIVVLRSGSQLCAGGRRSAVVVRQRQASYAMMRSNVATSHSSRSRHENRDGSWRYEPNRKSGASPSTPIVRKSKFSSRSPNSGPRYGDRRSTLTTHSLISVCFIDQLPKSKRSAKVTPGIEIATAGIGRRSHGGGVSTT